MWALGLELIGRLTEDAPGFHQRLWGVRIVLTKEQLPWCSGTGLTCLWGKVASLPVGVFTTGLSAGNGMEEAFWTTFMRHW